MTTNLRIATLVAFAALMGLAGRGAAADVEPTKVQFRAQKGITDGAAKITKMAYVTSNSHTDVQYVKGTVYRDDSFDLTYKFFYRDSDNDPQTYTLRFDYDKAGKMTDIAVVSHTSFWEPFNAAKIAGAVLEGVAKELNK